MAQATSINIISQGTVTETLSTEGAATPTLTIAQYNTQIALSAGTTVPATKSSVFTPQLSGGALTIDLTSLTDPGGAALNATGLKLQYLKFNNGVTTDGVLAKGSNATVTLTNGATNGYDLFGGSNSLTIVAGGWVELYFNDLLDDVGSTDKDIDLSGAGTDAFECVMVFG